MKPNGIITLCTDFGIKDGFVGVMKGIIYGINPHARIVDITHHIPPQNIQAGSFILQNSYKHFPDGTIHVVVVDPGVGSERKILAVAANNHFFIAPDNQILKYIFYKNETLTVAEVLNKSYFSQNISRTFHGRDIFAPVAAHLSNGVSIESLGEIITDFDRGKLQWPVFSKNKITGTIIHIDTFGNLISNIEEKDLLNRSVSIKAGKILLEKLSNSYAEVNMGQPLAIFGSSGFLELAVRNGNAKDFLSLNIGDRFEVDFV
ncbi:SAM-dependent chlorinase/fluorinase [candidate division KSB1 bacterium]|nr:SAM-dependent chlorinase/fluorinase [candidate division KSB1 bacterium]MBL7093256.1 SAM-dependent chlorinase/fluorinase [candidate division KSB1 bacterium]